MFSASEQIGSLAGLLGGAKMRWGTLYLLLVATSECETRLLAEVARGSKENHFLSDVALYLTGSESNAAAVFTAYKKRVDPRDPALPYPLHGAPPPTDLESFLKSVDFDPTSDRWRKRRVKSRVKGTYRTLYRLVTRDENLGISIAETENRETEIAVETKKGGNWNYFVYDEKGTLAGSSLFATMGGKNVSAPAPLTCLTCHYDRDNRRFVQLPVAFSAVSD